MRSAEQIRRPLSSGLDIAGRSAAAPARKAYQILSKLFKRSKDRINTVHFALTGDSDMEHILPHRINDL